MQYICPLELSVKFFWGPLRSRLALWPLVVVVAAATTTAIACLLRHTNKHAATNGSHRDKRASKRASQMQKVASRLELDDDDEHF